MIIWVGLCFIVAMAGDKRKIGYWPTWFLSFFLTPVVGLIAALCSKKKADYHIPAAGYTQGEAVQGQAHSYDDMVNKTEYRQVNNYYNKNTYINPEEPTKFKGIEELGYLLDQGRITEIEFKREKRKILRKKSPFLA